MKIFHNRAYITRECIEYSLVDVRSLTKKQLEESVIEPRTQFLLASPDAMNMLILDAFEAHCDIPDAECWQVASFVDQAAGDRIGLRVTQKAKEFLDRWALHPEIIAVPTVIRIVAEPLGSKT